MMINLFSEPLSDRFEGTLKEETIPFNARVRWNKNDLGYAGIRIIFY